MSTFMFKDLKCDLTIRDVANIYFSSMEITGFGAKFTEYCDLVIRIHLYCTLQLGYQAIQLLRTWANQPVWSTPLTQLSCF